MRKYYIEKMMEEYEEILRRQIRVIDDAKSMLTRKYERDMKALDDQMANFRKLLQDGTVPIEIPTLDDLIPVKNVHKNIVPECSTSSNSNFTVLRNNSNNNSYENSNVRNDNDDNSRFSDRFSEYPTDFDINEDSFEIANEEFMTDSNPEEDDEDVEGEEEERDAEGESRFPHVKEEIEADYRGIPKKKCLYCAKYIGKNTIKRHEISCWEKRGGLPSSRYICTYNGCNYQKQKTFYARNHIRLHIQRKHHVRESEIERFIDMKKN